MKKYFLLIGIIAVLATGCSNTNNTSCVINANGSCITKIATAPSANGNYWEGAKQICGGEQNLPTSKDLANIASYVYQNTSIKPNEDKKNLTKNKEHFSQFDIDNFGAFDIWSSKKGNNMSAYVRGFYPESTSWDMMMTDNDAGVLAVCVKH